MKECRGDRVYVESEDWFSARSLSDHFLVCTGVVSFLNNLQDLQAYDNSLYSA